MSCSFPGAWCSHQEQQSLETGSWRSGRSPTAYVAKGKGLQGGEVRNIAFIATARDLASINLMQSSRVDHIKCMTTLFVAWCTYKDAVVMQEGRGIQQGFWRAAMAHLEQAVCHKCCALESL